MEKWGLESQQDGVIEATLRSASHHERLSVKALDLDAKPELLNATNCTLDLTTFDQRPHSPTDLLTRVTAAAYDPDAHAPYWGANLERFLPDPEDRAFLQRCAGAALLGYRREELIYLIGKGANFKSTILRAIREALGEYGDTMAASNLVRQSGQHQKSVADKAEIANLRGRRLVTTSEIESDQVLSESFLKQTTEDVIMAQHKYGKPFKFTNEMTFFFSANHRLTVQGTDRGTWRRIMMIEFKVDIPDEEVDTTYFEKFIQPELPGVLAWMVEGLKDYRARGDKLDPPAHVQAWNQSYRESQDVIAAWLKSECELASDKSEDANDLWNSYYGFTRGDKNRLSRSNWGNRLNEDYGMTGPHRRRKDDGSQHRAFDGVELLVNV